MLSKRQILTEAEKGWLAGIIEGEGSITMHAKHKAWKGWKGIGVDLSVWVVNIDEGIIDKTSKLLKKMGIEPRLHKRKTVPLFHENGSRYKSPEKTLVVIGTSKMDNILELLRNIKPYLAGEKKARASLMVQFIERRLARKGEHTKKGAPWFDGYDWEIVRQFYEISGGTLPREVQEILAESTSCKNSNGSNLPTMRQLRMKLGISQADIASKLGISPTMVSLYENGHRRVPIRVARKIASILKVTPDKLQLRQTIHPLTQMNS
jgi:DNA-binding XRE family transcriptional regulator